MKNPRQFYSKQQKKVIKNHYQDRNSIQNQKKYQHSQTKDINHSIRQHSCPCGKSYLTSCALFNHIKCKHGDQKLDDVIRNKKQQNDKYSKNQQAEQQQYRKEQIQNKQFFEAQYDYQSWISQLTLEKNISYQGKFIFSTGYNTCQDMASHFLCSLRLHTNSRKMLICFMNYLKFFSQLVYGDQFWQSGEPSKIVLLGNQVVNSFKNYQELFPLSTELIIELLFVLFQWMYEKMWTNHRLLKINSLKHIKLEQ